MEFPRDWADGEAGRFDDRCHFLSPPVNGSTERVRCGRMWGGAEQAGMDSPSRPVYPRGERGASFDVSAAFWINRHICVSVLVC